MRTFKSFMDKEERKNVKHLGILHKVFEHGGMKVSSHLESEEPYIFVSNSDGKSLSFDGVRVYSIGGNIAYRVQKSEETHPYGRAYLLDLEEMFNDLVSENKSSEESAKQVIKEVNNGIKKFFNNSAEAESEIRDKSIDSNKDPLGRVVIQSTGTDYSNSVSGKGTNYGG